jgi:hypothetical protein
VVVERRVVMSCSLVDMRNGNLVDVTVKENKAIFGLFTYNLPKLMQNK